MQISKHAIEIKHDHDIVLARKLVRECANELKFSILNQTKLVTAASELMRNIIKYANSGTVNLNIIHNGSREGLQIIFEDQGPGIPDIPKVMAGGYTTGGGLGLGLSGSKRLVDEFDIKSIVGKGTCIKIVLWK